MSINIGSILGFFICGYLGENIGWHYGFGAAGIGMALGLLQFILSKKYLGDVGLLPSSTISENHRIRDQKILFVGILVIFLIKWFYKYLSRHF